MDWTISPDLVRVLIPLVGAHSAIGLGIVGAVMWMRSDKTLRWFGVGIGLFAVSLGLAAITTAVQPSADLLRYFSVVNIIALLASVLVFLRVGVDDYSFRWQRITLAAGVIWAALFFVLAFWLSDGDLAFYSEARFVVMNLQAIPAVLLIFGLAFAFFEGAHIAVEHSHGEPYRTILLGAMSVLALTMVVTAIAAESDAIRFVNALVASAASGVMWVAVVVHERKEIAREREEMTRRLTGESVD